MPENARYKHNKIIIFIPTLNEIDNIIDTVNAVLSVPLSGLEVLVVDDRSTDGTIEAVKKLAERDSRVKLMVRSGPTGRGYAGVEAFRHARDSGTDLIVEMDADGSHSPSDLPAIIEASAYHDVVIGSRLVSGGRDCRPLFPRRILTRLAGLYTRTVTGLKILDITSGYRAFNRPVLESMPLDEFVSSGPSILQEQLYFAYHNDFDIREVPVTFTDRQKGTTKLDFPKLVKCLAASIMIRKRNIILPRQPRG